MKTAQMFIEDCVGPSKSAIYLNQTFNGVSVKRGLGVGVGVGVVFVFFFLFSFCFVFFCCLFSL